MASPNQINLEYVIHKLEFVEKLHGRVNAAVADYINEVISAGKDWIESSGDNATFSNISQKMDCAVDFLSLKYHEISEQHRTQTSVENKAQESQQVLKPVDEPQRTLTVMATPQCTQTTESGPDQLPRKSIIETDLVHQQVLARFGVNEEAISSLRTNVEKTTENQAGTDKRFEDVEAKLLDINKQLSDLSIAEKQQKTRLKEHTDKITDKQAEIQKHCESRLQSLEKLLKKLTTKQDKLEDGCSRDGMNENLERKIKDICDDTEIVKCKCSDLESWLEETDSTVKDLFSRMVSQEQVTQSLCTKVDTNMETLKTFSASQERNDVILREFKDTLQVIETRIQEELEKLEEKFQHTEAGFKNVCQLMVNRLKPLEDLRSVLNQRARTQVDNVKQLHKMVKELAAISPKVRQLEAHITTPAIGFSAWTNIEGRNVVNSVVTSYSRLICRGSGHFNLRTGIFTAPVAGIYMTFIRVVKLKDNDDIYQVKGKSSLYGPWVIPDPVCRVSSVKSGHVCDLGLIQMEAGDMLYVETDGNMLYVQTHMSIFPCINSIVFSSFIIR